jgi:hypothetical protein
MSVIDILAYIVILIAFLAFLYYIYDWIFGDSQLKCIVSDINGETYCIQERKRMKDAVNLLAKVTDKGEKLVNHLAEKYPDNDFVKVLKVRFDKNKIRENLPTSTLTSFNENKDKISLCLNREKGDNDGLIDEETLMFVLLHEISHYGNTLGHQSDFWNNFAFVLKEAEQIGVYKNVNYKENPQSYCGITINSSPYFSEIN